MTPLFMQTFTGFDIGVPCGFELIEDGWVVSEIEPYSEIFWNGKVYLLCMAVVQKVTEDEDGNPVYDDEPMKWQIICEEA